MGIFGNVLLAGISLGFIVWAIPRSKKWSLFLQQIYIDQEKKGGMEMGFGNPWMRVGMQILIVVMPVGFIITIGSFLLDPSSLRQVSGGMPWPFAVPMITAGLGMLIYGLLLTFNQRVLKWHCRRKHEKNRSIHLVVTPETMVQRYRYVRGPLYILVGVWFFFFGLIGLL